MNAVNHDLDPIAEALHRAASDLTLRRGSHVAVVRTATRRRHRRRRAVAAGAVIAVGGGSVLTIQQLTRPTTPTLRSPADDGTPTVESVDNVDNVDVSPPTAATSGAAVRVESDLVWNVVTPDAASSVAFSGRLVLPGLIVSTAPGRNTAGGAVMWRSDDGITWEQVGGELPVGSLYGNMSFDGNRIYSVGTAPGAAAPEPNPLLLAASEDAGSTWNTIPLPVDSNANADLPYVRRAYAMGQAAAISGGVLVSVNTVIELDIDRLGIGNAYSWSADGVLTQADPDCRPDDQPSGMGVATTILSYTATTGDVGGCELTTRPWSEYGVPEETVAAMSDHLNRLFTITDDGTITEITGPDIRGQLRPVASGEGTNPIFLANDSLGQPLGWYRYLDDGSWQELDVPPGVYDIQPVGNGLVSTVSSGYTVEVAMSGDGSTWTRTDLRGLYDDASLLSSWQSAASPSGALTMAVSSTPDLIAVQGGSEVTIGGVTARLDRAGGQVAIVDAATGEPIDPSLITDTSVGVSVADGNGGVRALFPIETLYEDLMRTEPGQAVSWDVVRTMDGVSFSRESIAELLGLTDADISSIAHISSNESKVVIAVTLTERDDSGIPKQLVLVGTPRG